MTLDEFENQVISACIVSPIVVSVLVIGTGVTWIRLRAYLTDGSLLDTFFNESTGKTAFALIREEQRIFGADNTSSWHWHPFDAPGSHVPTIKAVSFQDFIKRIEEYLSES